MEQAEVNLPGAIFLKLVFPRKTQSSFTKEGSEKTPKGLTIKNKCHALLKELTNVQQEFSTINSTKREWFKGSSDEDSQ